MWSYANNTVLKLGRRIFLSVHLFYGVDICPLCVLKGMEVSCFYRGVLHLHGWGYCSLLRRDIAHCQGFILLGIPDIPSLAKHYFLLAEPKSNNCCLVLLTDIKSMSYLSASFNSSMSWYSRSDYEGFTLTPAQQLNECKIELFIIYLGNICKTLSLTLWQLSTAIPSLASS